MIDGFSNFIVRKAQAAGRQITRCSFDGQDSILGADYVFTNHTNFLMVEFKYEESDLKHEALKPRRLKLCRILDDNDDWRGLSSQCHYVAWSEEMKPTSQGKRFVNFNGYYDEVCNCSIFGEYSKLKRDTPSDDLRLRAGRLADEFLSGNLGMDFQSFEQYTDWLMGLEDSDPSGIELMVDDSVEDELILMDFPSVRELKSWLDRTTFQPPKPRNSRGPRMG
ncbi:hypothetical protein ACYZUA_17230 [Pseudomonas sp. LS2P72]